MLIKNCVFSQFIATHPLHEGDQLVRVYTVTPIGWPFSERPITAPARERLQSLENSWKKNTIFNEHLVSKGTECRQFYKI